MTFLMALDTFAVGAVAVVGRINVAQAEVSLKSPMFRQCPLVASGDTPPLYTNLYSGDFQAVG